jgi:hypothetical protein
MVQVGDSRDQSETQAVAGCRPARVETVKPAENFVALRFRDARPVIADRDSRSLQATPNAERHIDMRAGVRVLYRVLDQIGQHLRQQSTVARNDNPGGDSSG